MTPLTRVVRLQSCDSDRRILTKEWKMQLSNVQVPAIPMTPTLSRILAISLTDKVPLLTQKKSSQAVAASLSLRNCVLKRHSDQLSYHTRQQSVTFCLLQELEQPFPEVGLRELGVVRRIGARRERARRQARRVQDEGDVDQFLVCDRCERRGGRQHDGWDAAVARTALGLLRDKRDRLGHALRLGGGGDRRRAGARGRWRSRCASGRCRSCRRIPARPGPDHEVDRVPVFDVVFLQELAVDEGFALEQQPQGVCRWGAGQQGDLGFYAGDGVGWVDTQGVCASWLHGFDCDADCAWDGCIRVVSIPEQHGVCGLLNSSPVGPDSVSFRSGGEGTGICVPLSDDQPCIQSDKRERHTSRTGTFLRYSSSGGWKSSW